MSVKTTPKMCCDHRGSDHEGAVAPAPGARCTVPGCKCLGWIPRKGKRMRGKRAEG